MSLETTTVHRHKVEMVGVDQLICPEYGDHSCCTDNGTYMSAAMIDRS